MNEPYTDHSPHRERLNRIVAEYVEAVDAGRMPDRRELIVRNPELAAELEQFFEDHDRMSDLARGTGVEETRTPSEPDALTLPPAADWRPETSTLPPPQVPDGESPLSTVGRSGGPFPPASGMKGRCFGDYELLGEIARGGMGVVYKARQISLNRTVALKMILAGQLAGREDVARFHAEAESAANLDHPGIVPIFEVGCHENQHYFSMSYVEGKSLADRLRDGPLPPREAAHLILQVAEAVQYAHEHGVIHRDLKPANVLLEENADRKAEDETSADAPGTTAPSASWGSGFRSRPRITDFGLAKRVEGDSHLTASGQILGTPGYMPPEQAAGNVDRIGVQSDVYALGAILYACLTGRPPFEAATPLDTVMQVLDGDPPAPRWSNRAIPRDLDTICMKCLEKEPGSRYASARALADDLERYLRAEPIEARPPGPIGRLYRWSRRRPALAVTIVAVALFYTNHLINLYMLKHHDEGGTFHLSTTGLLGLWVLGAAGFQYLARRFRNSGTVLYGWAGMDVLLFTAFLSMADGPKSTVLIGYLLLVAGTGLRFRRGLVWFVTGLSVAGYLWLVADALLYRPQYTPKANAFLPFLMALAIMGLAMHFIVHRARALDPAAPDGR